MEAVRVHPRRHSQAFHHFTGKTLNLRCRLRREREQVDLAVETSQLQSSYSRGLTELMQREEQAGGSGDFAAREEIAATVDKALAQETQRHFSLQADANAKKLSTLYRVQVP